MAVIHLYVKKRFAFPRKHFFVLFCFFLKKDVPYVLFLHTRSTEVSWGRFPQSGMLQSLPVSSGHFPKSLAAGGKLNWLLGEVG